MKNRNNNINNQIDLNFKNYESPTTNPISINDIFIPAQLDTYLNVTIYLLIFFICIYSL